MHPNFELKSLSFMYPNLPPSNFHKIFDFTLGDLHQLINSTMYTAQPYMTIFRRKQLKPFNYSPFIQVGSPFFILETIPKKAFMLNTSFSFSAVL